MLALLCLGAAKPVPTAGEDPLQTQPDFLPVDEAFVVSARRDGQHLLVRWDMPRGYYLYRHAFSVQGANAALGAPVIPDGKRKVDEYFGDSEIYYDSIEISAPIKANAAVDPTFDVTYQGCADYGLCYPPQRRQISFAAGGAAVVSKPSS